MASRNDAGEFAKMLTLLSPLNSSTYHSKSTLVPSTSMYDCNHIHMKSEKVGMKTVSKFNIVCKICLMYSHYEKHS